MKRLLLKRQVRQICEGEGIGQYFVLAKRLLLRYCTKFLTFEVYDLNIELIDDFDHLQLDYMVQFLKHVILVFPFFMRQ